MDYLQGAEMTVLVYVYVCVYVYTWTSAGRRKLVDGWYLMRVLSTRICGIAGVYDK